MLKTSTECEIEEEKEKLLRSRYAQRIRTTERAKKKESSQIKKCFSLERSYLSFFAFFTFPDGSDIFIGGGIFTAHLYLPFASQDPA